MQLRKRISRESEQANVLAPPTRRGLENRDGRAITDGRGWRMTADPIRNQDQKPEQEQNQDHDQAANPLDQGFAGTVRPVVGQLHQVARRILESDDLAWEAVQDALLNLWQRGDAPPNPRAWLVQAVIHRSLHLRRTLRRRREHEAKASRIRPESSDLGNPLQAIMVEESRSELRDAVASLAEKHQNVISLYTWEGLDYESIATRLDIPIGTVRSRLNRAREALRNTLARDRPHLE